MNPVGWFEIYVDDMNRAKAFYEKILKITLEELSGVSEWDLTMYSFTGNMKNHGATGALVKMKDMKAGGNSTLVYFSCEDCAVEESRVEAAGGKVQQSKMAIGEHGFITLVVDTEGSMIGLHSMK